MGANYSFYVKTIETHARSFFKVIIFSIGSVQNNWVNFWFFIMKELWDLAQENLVNIQGSYGKEFCNRGRGLSAAI